MTRALQTTAIALAVMAAALRLCLADEPSGKGFHPLFDGHSLARWTNHEGAFEIEDGLLKSREGKYGYLYTEREFGDFELRLEFKLTPGANNGVAVRASGRGDPAYEGIELQILDDADSQYAAIKPYQVHGSAYGIAPAERGALRPVGEWNDQTIRCVGRMITVTLNGQQILDVDLNEAAPGGKTIDGREHPGLNRDRGRIGLMGHNDIVYFRRIEICEIVPADAPGFFSSPDAK